MIKYEKSGWLTKEAIRYGNQHRQPNAMGTLDVRLRSFHGTQYRVETLKPKTEEVISEETIFALALARRRYSDLVGQKPKKVHSPDANQDIIL